MSYNWKKAIANAALIFLGVVISKIGTDANIQWTWVYWHPILSTAGTVTFFAELRYIVKFLSNYGDNGSGRGMMKPYAVICLLVAASLFVSGCPKIEKDAYLAAVGAKAFLDSEYGKHPECLPNTKTGVCDYLAKAVAAKDLLISAGELYCGGEGFATGGACYPPSKKDPKYSQVYDRLQAALAGYKQIEKDLRALLGKGGN